MSILWCGGEDIDFSKGGTVNVSTTASHIRSGYSRSAVYSNSATVYLQTLPFVGGALTSCWLSFRAFPSGGSWTTSILLAGLTGSSTASSGLYVGTATAGSGSRLGLFTFDGVTKTQLAAEVGNSLPITTMARIDVQLVNYGATATVNVYCNGTLIITVTNTDVRIAGLTSVDSVSICSFVTAVNAFCPLSEFIVADEDVRGFPGLVTMALTGAGTTDDWTGTFSNINGTTISDANPAFVNLNDKLEEFNVTDLPAGTFAIKAIKIAMRAAKAAGTPTQIALGYNEGGTVTVEGDIALTTAYATYEQLDNTNPRTAGVWDQSIMNALQLTAKSRA